MLDELMKRYPSLSSCKTDIENAAQAMIDCYTQSGKVMTCGNGGSCADADHIVGELMKGFLKKRPLSDAQKHRMLEQYPKLNIDFLDKLQCGLPALSLSSLTALNTANLIFSTISITTSFVASYLTFLRSPYYAIGYSANDVVLIILWILASVEDISYLPMVACFIMFLFNDLYGFYNWRRMQKRQK